MSSSRIPKRPIPILSTNKAVSSKNSKTKTSSSINSMNKEPSKPRSNIPAVHQASQKKKQANTKKSIESPHSSTNSYHSTQSTRDKASSESSKQKTDQISILSLQQSELINFFDSDLMRAETLTGNFPDESNLTENSDQFSTIKSRFQFLVDNYIKQNEELNKLLAKKEEEEEEIKQKSIENQELESKNSQMTINNSKLGEEIRYLFDDQNDNDTIIQKVKVLTEFIETTPEDESLDEVVDRMKKQMEEAEIMKEKYDQILSEKVKIEKKLRKTEKKLQDSQSQINEEDKEICDVVKSIYHNRQITDDLVQYAEKDIDLSFKVRTIFNEEENNDAILRTIESNKETAKDEDRVSELVMKLEELKVKANQLNKKHEREQKAKDMELLDKAQEIDELNCQINDQANSIQKLKGTIETNEQKLIEKDQEIDDLKQSYETQLNKLREEIQSSIKEETMKREFQEQEKIDLKQSYESQIEQLEEEIRFSKSKESEEITEVRQTYEEKMNELQFKLLNQERIYSELKCEFSEQQQMKEQQEKEIIELRLLVNNAEDTKSKEIEFLKGQLLAQLNKQKEIEMKNQVGDRKAQKKANLELHDELKNKQKEINQLKEEISRLISRIEELEINKSKEEIKISPCSNDFLYEDININAEEQEQGEQPKELSREDYTEREIKIEREQKEQPNIEIEENCDQPIDLNEIERSEFEPEKENQIEEEEEEFFNDEAALNQNEEANEYTEKRSDSENEIDQVKQPEEKEIINDDYEERQELEMNDQEANEIEQLDEPNDDNNGSFDKETSFNDNSEEKTEHAQIKPINDSEEINNNEQEPIYDRVVDLNQNEAEEESEFGKEEPHDIQFKEEEEEEEFFNDDEATVNQNEEASEYAEKRSESENEIDETRHPEENEIINDDYEERQELEMTDQEANETSQLNEHKDDNSESFDKETSFNDNSEEKTEQVQVQPMNESEEMNNNEQEPIYDRVVDLNQNETEEKSEFGKEEPHDIQFKEEEEEEEFFNDDEATVNQNEERSEYAEKRSESENEIDETRHPEENEIINDDYEERQELEMTDQEANETNQLDEHNDNSESFDKETSFNDNSEEKTEQVQVQPINESEEMNNNEQEPIYDRAVYLNQNETEEESEFGKEEPHDIQFKEEEEEEEFFNDDEATVNQNEERSEYAEKRSESENEIDQVKHPEEKEIINDDYEERQELEMTDQEANETSQLDEPNDDNNGSFDKETSFNDNSEEKTEQVQVQSMNESKEMNNNEQEPIYDRVVDLNQNEAEEKSEFGKEEPHEIQFEEEEEEASIDNNTISQNEKDNADIEQRSANIDEDRENNEDKNSRESQMKQKAHASENMIQEEFRSLDQFEKMEEIGSGSFGKVFKVIDKQTGAIYAAKISRRKINKEDEASLHNLIREVDIISKISHPSVLKFIYFDNYDFKHQPKPVLITEYASNGSVEDFIRISHQSHSNDRFNATHGLIIMYGIASGMSYLHLHNIIHRDLKPSNILLDDYLNPKITDFGLSKVEEIEGESQVYKSVSDLKGTPCYMSPEIFERYEYSKSSDVYAYGVILYELLTGEKAFIVKSSSEMIKLLKKCYRPKFTSPISDSYKKLIEECWSQEPKERPTFADIVERLKTDRGFITEEIDEDEYQKYVNYIESYKRRNNNVSFSLRQTSTGLFSFEEFNKLDIKCQSFVREAQNDATKEFIVGKCLIEGQENFEQNTDLGVKYLESSIEGGNIESVKYYSNLLIKGGILTQDLSKAKSILEKRLKDHDETIFFLYGKLLKKEKKMKESLKYFKKASEGGHAESMYECGKMIYKGEGCPVDIELANEYFELARKNGCEKGESFLQKQEEGKEKEASNNINELFYKTLKEQDKDKETMCHIFKEAADNGNVDAMYEYAKMKDKGDGVETNKEEACKYYCKAANKGHLESIFRYAEMKDKGEGVEIDKEVAYQYYKISADNNNTDAIYRFAEMSGKGEGAVVNKKVSFEYYKKGADEGQLECIYHTAAMLCNGDGVATNDVESAKYFKIGADKGDIRCMNYYGVFLHDGIGVECNKEEAAKYIKKAADGGNTDAMNLYAAFLENGEGVAANKSESVRYCKMSADKGNAKGMYNYASMLKYDDSVPFENKEYVRYMKMAADNGYVMAMLAYAQMVHHGDGVPVDLKEAARYYKMGADHGDTIANLNYVMLCSSAEKNYDESIKYLKMAAEINTNKAKRYSYDRVPSNQEKEEIQTTNNHNEKVSELNEEIKNSPTQAITNDFFSKLDKKCQDQICEASKDPDELFMIGKYFMKGEQNFPKNLVVGVNCVEQSIRDGSTEAAVYYIKLLNKDGVIPRSLTKAEVYLNKYIKKEDVRYLYLSGLILKNSLLYNRAKGQFEKGIEKGDAHCMFEYGKMLLRGKGFEKNAEKAMEYFELAKSKGVDEVDAYLCKRKLRSEEREAKSKFYEATEPKEDEEDTEKIYNYAIKLYYGYEDEPSPIQYKKEAFKFFKIAADRGHVESIGKCARMLRVGESIKVNNEEALKYAKIGIEKENADSFYVYGTLLQFGIGVPLNIEEAIRFYKMAIEKGQDDAMNSYALLLENGEGCKKDIQEAMHYYKMAIEKGNRESMYNYAYNLSNGIGVEVDKAEAARYYRMAAKKGLSNAMNNFGLMLLIGDGIPVNKEIAAHWFKIATFYKNVISMNNLGNMLRIGNGIPMDKEKAFQYYKEAADLGDSDGMVNAGKMLDKGDGIPVNKEEAKRYFIMAADKGNQEGLLLCKLGNLSPT